MNSLFSTHAVCSSYGGEFCASVNKDCTSCAINVSMRSEYSSVTRLMGDINSLAEIKHERDIYKFSSEFLLDVVKDIEHNCEDCGSGLLNSGAIPCTECRFMRDLTAIHYYCSVLRDILPKEYIEGFSGCPFALNERWRKNIGNIKF